MTYLDLVRQYLPDVDDREADHILWEHTAFPVCDLETLQLQLAEMAKPKTVEAAQ